MPPAIGLDEKESHLQDRIGIKPAVEEHKTEALDPALLAQYGLSLHDVASRIEEKVLYSSTSINSSAAGTRIIKRFEAR